MSLNNALSNAYSGLAAISRSAETVSNNVSNAMTEGYSRQQVVYSAVVLGGHGGGVRVENITRSENALATQLRQASDSGYSNISTKAGALARLSNAMGEPGQPSALAVQYAMFEDSISMAISAPDSIALQNGILQSAKNLAGTFNQISAEISRVRIDADANIAKEVELVNGSLKQIESLNEQIRILSFSGRNISALKDQRQLAISLVNSIIPIRQTNTNNGEIALFSQGGEILLNGTARTLEFTQTYLISPSMSFVSGALSGLSINGKSVDISATGRSIVGGSLSANFLIRDTTAPEFQIRLDALSIDLIERFQNSGIDPTLAIGDAGMFTDAGAAYSPANGVGISGRITINASFDPMNGGEIWRLRDGLGAITPGAVGESAQLIRMANALSDLRSGSPALGLNIAMSGAGFAEELTSYWAAESNRTENETANKLGLRDFLWAEELHATGVDTDKEMQSLLLIEQAYAANARVISVLDRLMDKLLEM